MPVIASHLKTRPIHLALLGGAIVATIATALTLVVDPTAAMNGRLDKIDPVFGKSVAVDAGRVIRIDASRMAQTPIFIMTSGAAAYKEKGFQLFGVSVSPKRRAALVSIDGAAPVWMVAGVQVGDVRLVEVGGGGAVFETPVGTRNVSLTDQPAAADSASAGQ